jgi:spore coat protein A
VSQENAANTTISCRLDAAEIRSSVTRRRFLGQSIAAAATAIAPRSFSSSIPPSAGQVVAPLLDPNSLARFVDPLPMPVLAKPQGERAVPNKSGERVPFYRVSTRAIECKLHRDLAPTNLWSYGGSVPGVMFETWSGRGMLVEWANELPPKHFLPIDYSLHGASRDLPEVRNVVHLHGGKTPAEYDGFPEDWYAPGQSRTYYYPNEQEAALLWYHDHAMGINRLNVYAGLFGLHVIRDPEEQALHLPAGKYEVPLVLFDRHLRTDGQLTYPVSSDPEHPWISEVLGEVPFVNGKIFPYLDVEPRKYRFRVLNASNGRLYRLSFPDGVEVYQIGTDQGLLHAPVPVTSVLLAQAERADLIVDFASHRGARITLSDDAFTLMEFRIGTSGVADTNEIPSTLRSVRHIPESSAAVTRWLTLDEMKKPMSSSAGMLLNKTPWHMPITEKPRLGTTEIWEFANLTDDVHPIHLHMVKFQILDRRPFSASQYMRNGTLRYVGPAVPPDSNEMGWKDTVRVNAQTVTRIIVPFDGYPGRYVWHCHNLEHEDNEMMRPYEVLAATG